jgi:hypothetical protein
LRKADAAALCGLELADGSPAALRSISRFAGTGFLFHRFLSEYDRDRGFHRGFDRDRDDRTIVIKRRHHGWD